MFPLIPTDDQLRTVTVWRVDGPKDQILQMKHQESTIFKPKKKWFFGKQKIVKILRPKR